MFSKVNNEKWRGAVHGEIVNNTMEQMTANLIFEKTLGRNTAVCSLSYKAGKLFACEYTVKIKKDSVPEISRSDIGSRNEVEGKFGTLKTCYG